MKKIKRSFYYKLTDAQAVERIREIPDEYREIVARIVWWDWFAIRMVKNCTKLFDEWIIWPDPELPWPEQPEWTTIVPHLVYAGYPEWMAIRRLKPKSVYIHKKDRSHKKK